MLIKICKNKPPLLKNTEPPKQEIIEKEDVSHPTPTILPNVSTNIPLPVLA